MEYGAFEKVPREERSFSFRDKFVFAAIKTALFASITYLMERRKIWLKKR